MSKKRFIIATVLAIGLITPPLWFFATAEAPSIKVNPPTWVVMQLDTLIRSGDWDKAHQLIDYEAKGKNLVPDLWANGSVQDRHDLVAMLQRMFQANWKKTHDNPDFQATRISETLLGPNNALVEQGTEGFAFRYWLEKRSANWVIVDRTGRSGRKHLEPSGIVRTVRRQIKAQLGGTPLTLRDFVDNAPSWLGRINVHRIEVGK